MHNLDCKNLKFKYEGYERKSNPRVYQNSHSIKKKINEIIA